MTAQGPNRARARPRARLERMAADLPRVDRSARNGSTSRPLQTLEHEHDWLQRSYP